MKKLTVYVSPSCAFSAATLGFLLLRGADFVVVNLDAHPAQRASLAKRLAGRKLETPTLEAAGKLHVAPPLSTLKKQLATWGLSDDESPHQQLADAEG